MRFFIKKNIPSNYPTDDKKLNISRNKWVSLLFPIGGLLALVWFIARVLPKPSRMAYPCQRLAAPLAGGFVMWICGAFVSVFTWRRGKELFIRSRLCKAMVCFAVAGVVAIVAIGNMPEEPLLGGVAEANNPIGIAKGINPGRVVWVHNPQATEWGGTNRNGDDIGYGYWWQENHTFQKEVDKMMSRAITSLTDETTDASAWNALFHHFNIDKGKGDVGYVAGEKIMIKANLVVTHISWPGIIDGNCNQLIHLGNVHTSPQMILTLLRQLVNVAGVAQSDITVGDTICYFPNHYWDMIHSEFPDVHYLAIGGGWGREAPVLPSTAPIYWSEPDSGALAGKAQDYLPVSYAEAAYLINLSCLKAHSSGITVSAKNNYGSLNRSPNGSTATGHYDLHASLPNYAGSGIRKYRAHVDTIGHSKLGGNTLLFMVDGLYGGTDGNGFTEKWTQPPFNNDWPSSLFVSQDPVATDSVCYDFLLRQWPGHVANPALGWGADDFLHEAAQADNPPSGTNYHPDHPDTGGTGPYLSESLGVHEHWNNPTEKLYSRNLGTGLGIELIHETIITESFAGDVDNSGYIDVPDAVLLSQQWLRNEIVFEAEGYQSNTGGSGAAAGSNWGSKTGGGSIGGYMESQPNRTIAINSNIESDSPHLSYQVDFGSAGTYYLWVKGYGPSSVDNSYHYGINGSCLTTSGDSNGGILSVSTEFKWRSDDHDGARPTIVVPSAGVHSVDIWMYEDGSKIDQILLTTDVSFDPKQMADVNYDGSVNIGDFGILSGNFLSGDPLRAMPLYGKTYAVHKLNGSLTIDADWNKAQWQAVDSLPVNLYMGSEPSHKPNTQVKLLWDDDAIYVIFKVDDQYVIATEETINGSISADSCVEFFFSPGYDVEAGYYNLEVNCVGTPLLHGGALTEPYDTGARVMSVADIQQIEIATSIATSTVFPEITTPLTWYLEYRLPLSILYSRYPLIEPGPGVFWRANFYKGADQSSRPHWMTWSLVDKPGPTFHQPSFFGALEFVE